jgi:hypothetical protein
MNRDNINRQNDLIESLNSSIVAGVSSQNIANVITESGNP